MLDGEIACVDLETTGGSPLHHRVIEVGVVLMQGGEVVEEWSSLVNPGLRIPGNIVAFTGISNAMVADAPPFEALCDDLLGRLRGRLFVAHNARFDYGFLRTEFRRLGLRFRAPVLCTVKLSRRMDPAERGHGLDAVMARHDIACTARHRALGDARVLAEFLTILRRRDGREAVEQQVGELVHESPLPAQLDPELADDLPEGPGVYRFWGEDQVLLYVGKSRNLRTRVLAHFATAQTSSKALKLARQVRRVDWLETAGELGALLTESRWVKTLAPLHNRQLRGSGETWTLVLEPDGDGVRARVDEVEEKGTLPFFDEKGKRPLFFGLFRSRRDARRALEEIVRARGLCARELGLEPGEGGCFAFQTGRCRGACVGQEPRALHAARAQLAFAPHQLREWPFRGRIAIGECDWRGEQEIHVFDRWCHVATVRSDEELQSLGEAAAAPFDRDTYRILERFLRRPDPRARLVELQ